MPSTYSPSLRLELIGAGEQSGTWGNTTNTNLGTLLEQSIAGVQAITMSDANYTLSNFNGVSDEARRAVLVVSGTNAAIRDVIAPLVTKAYTIKNNTTGGFAINIRAATGASVSIPNGVTSLVYCDGTNFNLAGNQTSIAAGYGISIAVVGATTTITNSIFPAGTRSPFAQAAAPTGWTQDTTDNATNRMLRVVAGTGNGIGGSASPILNNTVPSHTHGFSTGGQSANHVHYDNGHVHGGGFAQFTTADLGVYGWSGTGDRNTGTGYASLGGYSADHSHSGSTDNGSSQTNWTPRYIDMIICSKN
jgi:hypothetical protein